VARILITSGPTRQYLDPVRYLTNASSGRMGAALAAAAIELGHDAIVVSGPVEIAYPPQAEVIPVVSTEEMFAAAREAFARCDGLIGAAAPCDYRPEHVETHKIAKTGEPLLLRLVETADVVAALGCEKAGVGSSASLSKPTTTACGPRQARTQVLRSDGLQQCRGHELAGQLGRNPRPAGNVVRHMLARRSYRQAILAVIQQRLIRAA
jgi:hypothetical protein